MNDSTLWLIGAAILIVAEMVSGTFYMLAIAIGFLAGAALAWLGFSLPVQLVVASLTSLLSVWLLKLWKRHLLKPANPSQVSNLLDLGQRVEVDQWIDARHARVRYRGSLWDAELAHEGIPQVTNYVIVAQRGNTLILDSQPHQPS
ncbi:NfeD family protein [Andreprevotia chitinilytica]|uniref:NfeD family protein n=1 Tax=Andreprevotia chitinilytica TaxID=396808 RepID=UPI00054F9D22|nr:NfeD family protein [Andreprevotia chitinilytica]